jgi:hypothetical protein
MWWHIRLPILHSIWWMLTCMVIAKSRVTEEHVFKDRKLIKKKYVIDWEEEQRLQQFFVKTI